MIISSNVKMLPSNFPLFIDLDVLDGYNVIVDNVNNILIWDSTDFSISLVEKHEQIYMKQPTENNAFYTYDDL